MRYSRPANSLQQSSPAGPVPPILRVGERFFELVHRDIRNGDVDIVRNFRGVSLDALPNCLASAIVIFPGSETEKQGAKSISVTPPDTQHFWAMHSAVTR